MHKVVRNETPLGLDTKCVGLRVKLASNPDAPHEWEKFSRISLKKRVIDSLEEMYKGCCCYCEGRVSSVSYAEIEHFRPKSKYKHLCYDYSNLHYCCKKCNIEKGDDFDDKMIDPVIDEPVAHMVYDKYIAIPLDERGKIMIDTVKLNERKDLVKERNENFDKYAKLYKVTESCLEKLRHRKLTNEEIEFIQVLMDGVKEQSSHGGSYCSMIKQNFLENILLMERLLDDKGYIAKQEVS